MSTKNEQLSLTINKILAENPKITAKDIKTVFIKNGGVAYFPAIKEDGTLYLAHLNFTHQEVLEAREAKKAERAKVKAEREAAKAQEKAQKAAEKAALAVEKAKATAQTVTVINSSAV